MSDWRERMQGYGANGSAKPRGFRRRDMRGILIDDGTGQGPLPPGGMGNHPLLPPRPEGGAPGRSGATGRDPRAAFGQKIIGWKQSMPPIPIYGPSDPDPHFDQTGKGPEAVKLPSYGDPGGSGASSAKPAVDTDTDRLRPNALGGGLSRWYALNPNPAPKGYHANVGLRKPAKPKL